MARRKSSTRTNRSRTSSGRRRTRTRSPKNALAQQLGKVIALVLVLGLVLLLQRYCSVTPEPFGPNAQIVSIDGDTLRAGDGTEYRIFGIDAPELHQTCWELGGKEWQCGRAAKVALTKIIKAGEVACDSRSTDRYGRSIAKCSAKGVADIGETLVRRGYAVDLGGKTGHAYASVEAEARANNRGIWRGTFQRPSEWRYENPRN
ncbi:MAG: thermonuclease family protein [Alphaproteobacteria bacterium]